MFVAAVTAAVAAAKRAKYIYCIILYNSDRCGVVWGGDGAGTFFVNIITICILVVRARTRPWRRGWFSFLFCPLRHRPGRVRRTGRGGGSGDKRADDWPRPPKGRAPLVYTTFRHYTLHYISVYVDCIGTTQ